MQLTYEALNLCSKRNKAALCSSQSIVCFIMPDVPGIVRFEDWSCFVELNNCQRKTISRLMCTLDSFYLSICVAAQMERKCSMINGHKRTSQFSINLALFRWRSSSLNCADTYQIMHMLL